ncbi:hypothetical protein K4K59_009287 [Colletotrichum sp. SAR11_240]|nr:hypothetical protein K4K59_009287 [Colletotrichum sp. SAR11_240]
MARTPKYLTLWHSPLPEPEIPAQRPRRRDPAQLFGQGAEIEVMMPEYEDIADLDILLTYLSTIWTDLIGIAIESLGSIFSAKQITSGAWLLDDD